ncbi:RNA-directed DNA polymerase [Sorangium sp. So ce448]|uniref:RNA-directed DNA polymerase n=1 Tax=Sorangium sp. So ce448 TaxID=3133314 RepID=UPI003F613237
MYTHAIPWALHTKAIAKSDRSTKKSATGGPPLLGNVLDEASRNIQSGQTVGIPIGPDTSLPLGEAILTEVDKIVVGRLGSSVLGFRFVDDYEFVFDTFAEAEQARNVLQDSLAEYELQLNPRKTRIIELPGTLDTPWAQDLAAFSLGSKSQSVLQSQLIRYFSRTFDLANAFPGDPVLKYAVRRLSDVDTKSASSVLQQLLFQAAVADPGTLQTALYIAYQHKRAGLPVATSSLTRALSAILGRHSALQHGGDIAWALWGAIVFGVRLGEPVVAALEKVTDPIGVLMTLFAESKSVFSRPLQKALWAPMAHASELFEPRWLVAYEAFGHGWLPAVTVDPAASDPFFASARSKGVRFVDPATPLEIPEPSPGGKYD